MLKKVSVVVGFTLLLVIFCFKSSLDTSCDIISKRLYKVTVQGLNVTLSTNFLEEGIQVFVWLCVKIFHHRRYVVQYF